MFRTELYIPKADIQIGLSDSILTLGSCFSTNIGNELKQAKFNASVNPFGIIYNPVSIFKLLKNSLINPKFDDLDFIERDRLWYHLDFHSEVTAKNRGALEKKIQEIYHEVSTSIKQAKWLMITLGTATVYCKQSSQQVVANCHKLPQKNFTKSMVTPAIILEQFKFCYEVIKAINPEINFLFTVSPIRHIKDTIPVNSLSKATLQLGVKEITKSFKDTYYFPAYELMMDDLRDYRFYEEDMLHPNQVAQKYIWRKFKETFFSEETKAFVKEWSQLAKSLLHKPFNVHSTEHQKFLIKLLKQLENMSQRINVTKEIASVKSQIL